VSDCRAFTCASKGCQGTIHLHHDVEAKLRRTHETFYCPAGHSNYFPGKTDEQKRIDSLERTRDRFRDLWEDALDERDEWKLRAKSCPFDCGYRVLRKSKPENIQYALAMHLVDEHGAGFPAEVLARAEARDA
jgi:hypothetical protein